MIHKRYLNKESRFCLSIVGFFYPKSSGRCEPFIATNKPDCLAFDRRGMKVFDCGWGGIYLNILAWLLSQFEMAKGQWGLSYVDLYFPFLLDSVWRVRGVSLWYWLCHALPLSHSRAIIALVFRAAHRAGPFSWQCCCAARDCWPSLALTASLLEILFAKIVFDYECLIWYRLLVLGIHMS